MASILLFHSVYGLREAERRLAQDWRGRGHTVTLPDLYDGRSTESIDAGFALCDDIGWDYVLHRAWQAAEALPTDTVLVGVSMGAEVVGCLLRQRRPTPGALLLHGLTELPAEFRLQLHMADSDALFPTERVDAWAEQANRAGIRSEIYRYPSAGHYFTDAALPDHDAPSRELALTRCAAFLRSLSQGR